MFACCWHECHTSLDAFLLFEQMAQRPRTKHDIRFSEQH